MHTDSEDDADSRCSEELFTCAQRVVHPVRTPPTFPAAEEQTPPLPTAIVTRKEVLSSAAFYHTLLRDIDAGPERDSLVFSILMSQAEALCTKDVGNDHPFARAAEHGALLFPYMCPSRRRRITFQIVQATVNSALKPPKPAVPAKNGEGGSVRVLPGAESAAASMAAAQTNLDDQRTSSFLEANFCRGRE